MNEIEQIFEHIKNKDTFLLSGGAGSGKTYTLVEVLKRIYTENSLAKVACITFTNVAVNEIKGRAPFENLHVSTIHSFLWDNIAQYQKNLKDGLIYLIDNKQIEAKNDTSKIIKVSYSERRNIAEGTISHGEIIVLAEYLFREYPLLCRILNDKYDYIFIDEYQDTDSKVVDIFLRHLQKSEKRSIIGFFGDSMQSIYNSGIGDIETFVTDGQVKPVIKHNNRRNPQIVIDLANKLRLYPPLQQEKADDSNAPNFNVIGDVKFLYSKEKLDIEAIKEKAANYFNGWDFKDSKKTKELYLTHNLFAEDAGFHTLMRIYDKDRILEYKDKIVKKIEKDNILIDLNISFGEVIDLVKLPTKPKNSKDDLIGDFIKTYQSLYETAKNYPFNIFKNIHLKHQNITGGKKMSHEDEKKGTERDDLIQHLFHIQECIYLYENKKYNEFLRKTQRKITFASDKQKLKEAIEKLISMRENSIEDVINEADNLGIWKKSNQLDAFTKEKEYVFNQVKQVSYKEFYNLYQFVEGFTAYSTQQGIKGAEFDNVFVLLNKGDGNQYNFQYLFEQEGTESVLKRTQKIFYVCCTRAKKNLVVYYHNPTDAVLERAKEWFGKDNVKEI